MRTLVQTLLDDIRSEKPVAYCRLVETRGSTPQKAGAMMLVYAHGEQAGTLGGGCVEAEVKRKALAILESGGAQIATFLLDNDYGWDDGLICGGRMQVLIAPVRPGEPHAYFEALHRITSQPLGATEAVVYDQEASGIAPPACYLFDDENRVVASMGNAGSAPSARLLEGLKSLAARPRAYAAGGVGYLPMLGHCRLLIVGGGHIGKAVAELAADLDFNVWVLDDRADVVSEERFPSADRRIVGAVEEVLPGLPIDLDTYCLIVTRGHNHDEEALFHLAQRGARYVGMIGSRRKIQLIFDDLLAEGISSEALARVHAPVGIDIGSQTVPEIAVSICAELVAHRNLEGRIPGRPEAVWTAGE